MYENFMKELVKANDEDNGTGEVAMINDDDSKDISNITKELFDNSIRLAFQKFFDVLKEL